MQSCQGFVQIWFESAVFVRFWFFAVGFLFVDWNSVGFFLHEVVAFLVYVGFEAGNLSLGLSLLIGHFLYFFISHFVPGFHPCVVLLLSSDIFAKFISDAFLVFLHLPY